MSRSALAHVAAACAAVLPASAVALAPAPAGADEPLLIEACSTEALPIEEVLEGATSTVTCEWVDPGSLMEMRSSVLVASHYDGTGGGGGYLDVYGTCDSSIAFGASNPWNNIISSTRHRTCGVVKHFDKADFSGSMEDTQGGWGMLINLTFMSNRTSSIIYP